MTQTAQIQITRRDGRPAVPESTVSFEDTLGRNDLDLRSAAVEVLQVNVGKLCNQTCKHCHVDASPSRTEIMERETINACLKVLRENRIPILDITGGAPELIPDFRFFVSEAKKIGVKIMVRHNLTVMFEDGFEDLPEFFAENKIELVSSLPYFTGLKTDAQRGDGVFEKSVKALGKLNEVGYGKAEGLILSLVYNPVGAFLPPDQSAIEADFKRELRTRYGIVFNNLYTITNMPIARYLDWLRRSGNEESYMRKLVSAFNPGTVEGLMCRNTLSVDWRGNLFDCDFNQMLEIRVTPDVPQTIFEFSMEEFSGRELMTNSHCFGCTAGSGSSCGGTVA
ncbi:MAG: arsenosugar biosynthesis radical SAM protein ArsS [Pyrinomonadaceae bacterium]